MDMHVLSACIRLRCQKVKAEEAVRRPCHMLSSATTHSSDQLVALYLSAFRRRKVKWWKKFFMHLFDVALVNAVILFNKTRLQQLVEKLAEGFVWKRRQSKEPHRKQGGIWVGTTTLIKLSPFLLEATQAWQRKCSVCVLKEGSLPQGRP
jgi:hypothetical protein